jgi:hypothetical protein
MKCPKCRKHRIRIKESRSDIFTCGPYTVKYCIGCGWEKTISPKDTIIVDAPVIALNAQVDAPVIALNAQEGVQGAVGVELSPVGAPEAVVEPVMDEEHANFVKRPCNGCDYNIGVAIDRCQLGNDCKAASCCYRKESPTKKAKKGFMSKIVGAFIR